MTACQISPSMQVNYALIMLLKAVNETAVIVCAIHSAMSAVVDMGIVFPTVFSFQ